MKIILEMYKLFKMAMCFLSSLCFSLWKVSFSLKVYHEPVSFRRQNDSYILAVSKISI